MLLTCPECHYSREIPDHRIPADAEVATCPKCKVKFRFRTLDLEGGPEDLAAAPYPEEPPATEPELAAPDQNSPETPPPPSAEAQDKDVWDSLERMKDQGPPPLRPQQLRYEFQQPPKRIEVPWERLEKFGFFPGLMETFKRVMFNPSLFFSRMPRTGLVKPLVFYVLLGEFQLLINYIQQAVGVAGLESLLGVSMESPPETLMVQAVSFVIYPAFFALALFLSAGVAHLFLMLFQAGSSGYETTFRASAYACSPQVLCFIPILGPLVAVFWSLAITVIAFKEAHQTTYPRVIAALLTPLFILVVLVTAVISVLVKQGLYLG